MLGWLVQYSLRLQFRQQLSVHTVVGLIKSVQLQLGFFPWGNVAGV